MNTPKVLVQSAAVENAQTTKYTSPAAGKGTWIDKFTITNTTAATPVTISVNIVPVSGAAAAGNLIISARSLAGGETYTCPELVGRFLGPGDFISWIAGAATSLTGRVEGRELT